MLPNVNGSGWLNVEVSKYSPSRSATDPLFRGLLPLLFGRCVPGSAKPAKLSAPELS